MDWSSPITSSSVVPSDSAVSRSGGGPLTARTTSSSVRGTCSRRPPPRRRRRRRDRPETFSVEDPFPDPADAAPESWGAAAAACWGCRPPPLRRLRRLRRCWLIRVLNFRVIERHNAGIRPQAFEVVIPPFLTVEDVDHEVDVIEQSPSAPPLAFPPVRLDAEVLAQFLFDLFGDGSDVPFGVSATDHEEVRDHELLRDVEDGNALGLLARRSARRPLCFIGCRHPGLVQLFQRVRKKSFPTMIVRSTLP